jgi:hypothetical protein
VINKIIFAGLGAFDRFMEIPSDEIAHVTAISQKLAESIYMKFYQYRDLYYGHTAPDRMAKFVSLFEISPNVLKEIHGQLNASGTRWARKDVDPKPRRNSSSIGRRCGRYSRAMHQGRARPDRAHPAVGIRRASQAARRLLPASPTPLPR